MTSQEIKTKLETETGLKFTVSKCVGSMSDFIAFNTRSRNGQPVEVEFTYTRKLVGSYPQQEAYFSNLRSFYLHKKHITI